MYVCKGASSVNLNISKVPLACVTLQDLIGVDMEQMADLLTVQENIARGEKVRKHLTREKAVGELGRQVDG